MDDHIVAILLYRQATMTTITLCKERERNIEQKTIMFSNQKPIDHMYRT